MLKVLNNPPIEIKETFIAVQHLYCGIDDLITTDNKGRLKETDLTVSWKTSQKWMANPQKFMDQLLEFASLID